MEYKNILPVCSPKAILYDMDIYQGNKNFKIYFDNYFTTIKFQDFMGNKKKIEIQQPNIVAMYNKNMGGVDKMDFHVSLHRIENTKDKRRCKIKECTRSGYWIEKHGSKYKISFLTTCSKLILYFLNTLYECRFVHI